MKSYKIISALLILSMITLIFSGCGGVNPVTPSPEPDPIPEIELEEEKSEEIIAEEDISFKLDEGLEIQIESNTLNENAILYVCKIAIDKNKASSNVTLLSFYEIDIIGDDISLSGTITLKFPVPAGMTEDEIIIGHFHGESTDILKGNLISGKYVVEVSEFSEFGVYSKNANDEVTTEDLNAETSGYLSAFWNPPPKPVFTTNSGTWFHWQKDYTIDWEDSSAGIKTYTLEEYYSVFDVGEGWDNEYTHKGILGTDYTIKAQSGTVSHTVYYRIRSKNEITNLHSEWTEPIKIHLWFNVPPNLSISTHEVEVGERYRLIWDVKSKITHYEIKESFKDKNGNITTKTILKFENCDTIQTMLDHFEQLNSSFAATTYYVMEFSSDYWELPIEQSIPGTYYYSIRSKTIIEEDEYASPWYVDPPESGNVYVKVIEDGSSDNLDAPTGVDATDGGLTGQVYITWNSVSGASHYRVYRATSEMGLKTDITSWKSGLYYPDYDVTPGTHYFYFVKAATSNIGADESPYSDPDEGWAGGANAPPTASFTADHTSGVVPLGVSFNASNSYDSDGSIVSYQWNFKDGHTGSGKTIYHSFDSIGSYDVLLTVTDNDGATDSTTKTINVTDTPNQSPTASFTADHTSGVVPLGVSFNASNSYDSDGSIVSYQWNFKDGHTGSGKTIYHSFDSIGSYDVLLTVTDNDGATDSTTKTINVTGQSPSPPTGVTASEGTYTDKVKITWNEVTEAIAYRVYRATSLTGTKTCLTGFQTDLYYYDYDVISGIHYFYFVFSANYYANSPFSDPDEGWAGGGSPDLIITSLTHSPASPTTVDEITFTAVVKNIGTGLAGTSTVSFQIGGESSPSTFSVPALAPDATYTVQRQLVLGVAQNYGTSATADVNNNVTESDETNNQRNDAFTVSPPTTYALRDIGPAGGWIFYDKGSYSNSWRYLEAAPVSTERINIQWGSYETLIGGTATGIGTGQSNTTAIVTWLNSHSETDKAAQLCNALVYGGYSDWFLPSIDELHLMYTNLKVYGVGDFNVVSFWSSSENDADDVWAQNFYYASQLSYDKTSHTRVRAVRAF